MKRRTYLVGLGATLGLSGVVGSGAFDTVSANRDVAVAVAEDDQAYLRLTQRGSGRRSYFDGNTIGFDIPGPDDDEYGGTDPEGLGRDSVYRFASDAASDEQGLFAIENQGTDPVEIFGSQDTTAGVPTVRIFNVSSGSLLTEMSRSDPLSVGNQIPCGLEIDTQGVDVRTEEYEVTLSINAVETST
ncbi:hypothetical protein [Haloarcula litorea]|uniref:hypothetical protein n=1 Tax=Haloarcula litorea TaxID=3032579 RepID=UPI0023E7C73B|nr:hypothetical protein [Halomicroarcula sp. GDY20]